jgi:hypothetical protein
LLQIRWLESKIFSKFQRFLAEIEFFPVAFIKHSKKITSEDSFLWLFYSTYVRKNENIFIFVVLHFL